MSQQVSITKLHVTLGVGPVPTVAIEVDDRSHDECERTGSEKTDIYHLIAVAVNRAAAIRDVQLLTRNCTTVNRGCGTASLDRVTVRLRRGGITTPNTGANHTDPVNAFLCAYVSALNCLLQRAGDSRSIVLAN